MGGAADGPPRKPAPRPPRPRPLPRPRPRPNPIMDSSGLFTPRVDASVSSIVTFSSNLSKASGLESSISSLVRAARAGSAHNSLTMHGERCEHKCTHTRAHTCTHAQTPIHKHARAHTQREREREGHTHTHNFVPLRAESRCRCYGSR